MQVTDDRLCFVCGQENSNGLQAVFTIEREEAASLCRLAVPGRFQGWQGVVHGGILATLLDEATIYACRALGEQFVTAELTVRYKKPVPVETEITVRARVTEQKRRLLTATAQIEVAGEVCAEADAKIFRLDKAGNG